MPKEIERKFLVEGRDWRELGKSTKYRQGYLSTVKERTVRVRTINKAGFLTIKGITTGSSRLEFEYEIPSDDAKILLDELCERPLIEKTRTNIKYEHLVWEIDEFEGENKGLIIAEVELEQENEKVELPNWIGKEVTDDPKYFNANLIKYPYSKWKE
jgi:CYTH domain-containing protein